MPGTSGTTGTGLAQTRAGALVGAGGVALGALGLTELALARRDDSLLDRLGEQVIAVLPVPLVEVGITLVGTADKTLLRGQLAATAVAALAAPAASHRVPSPGPLTGAAAGLAGLAALAAARRRLAQRIPVGDPLLGGDAPDRSGAARTPVTGFYSTDVTMRPRVVDAADWRLELRDAQGRSASLGAAALADLPLTQRDAVLACVHNRPGWDRLGQQRWTGLPIPDLLSAAGLSVPADDADLDLVMTGADGLVMVLPWREAVARGSWLVTGMDGRPLTAAHGHPARVMTPGLVGQYNGVKWASSLHLAPAGSVRATWVAKGWPVGPVTVPPSARIDSPGRVGMPPRLPVGRVRVPARCEVRGTAWAPAHGGVAGVEVSVSGGPWRPADLEPDHGPASWRQWRLALDLPPGRHELAARCLAADGSVQAGTGRPPYPQGADGFHRVRVRVG